MRRYYRRNNQGSGIVGSIIVLIFLIVTFIDNLFQNYPFLIYLVILIVILMVTLFIRRQKIKNAANEKLSYLENQNLNDLHSLEIDEIITEKISRNEKASYKGNINEFEIYEKLNNLNFYKKVLKNLYIPIENGQTTEIDLVMITNRGIFIIESKNYNGWIFGNSSEKYWTLSLSKNKKYKFLNPLWQNKLHLKSIKQMLNMDDSKFESIIVFGNKSVLKNIEKLEEGIKIINNKDLEELIYNIYNIKTDILSNEEVDALFNSLIQFKFVEPEVKEKHILNIQEGNK